MVKTCSEQPRGSRTSWFTGEPVEMMSILKKKKRVALKREEGYSVQSIKPQDHGIKKAVEKAVLERILLGDTSGILQKLIVDILHTTIERNVRGLILTAMRQMKWETQLFTKQLETHTAEVEIKNRELSEAEKEQIKKRDGYACLCCGADIKGKLQIDYINPSMWCEPFIENFQTLCVTCNSYKGNNEINFRCNTTKLSVPKNLDLSLTFECPQAIKTLTRIINFFYDCKAVDKVTWEVFTYTYNIYLYPSNNPEWLLQHKAKLLKFAKKKLGSHACDIKVTTSEEM